jgi:hypothetical protein
MWGFMPMDIKTIVKNNRVRFLRYRQGIAYYGVTVPQEGQSYQFPVPLEDIGDATLLAEDKAIVLMRYIRKAIAEGALVPYRGAQD